MNAGVEPARESALGVDVDDPHKRAAQSQWNSTPCGTGDFLARLEPESREWFDEIRRQRYEVSDPWMPQAIDFAVARGKRLLEIGYGIGSDLLTFAEHGAEVHGIDITAEHHRLAKANFALHGREARLSLCDAAEICYPSASFDVVYSHGVLHHTPDTERCVAEAHRVLKPGGLLLLSLYHRWSAPHFALVLINGVWRGDLWRTGYSGLLATIEGGADGVTKKPLVKLYSRGGTRRLLRDFSTVSIDVRHLPTSYTPVLKGRLLAAVRPRLERRFGWYVLGRAIK